MVSTHSTRTQHSHSTCTQHTYTALPLVCYQQQSGGYWEGAGGWVVSTHIILYIHTENSDTSLMVYCKIVM